MQCTTCPPLPPVQAQAALAHRMRHVPRQSSVASMVGRVGNAEIRRMASELEALRSENRRLEREAKVRACGGAGVMGTQQGVSPGAGITV